MVLNLYALFLQNDNKKLQKVVVSYNFLQCFLSIFFIKESYQIVHLLHNTQLQHI